MFKIDKLTDSNFHVWKQRMELILAFRELDSHIDENARAPVDPAQLANWVKNDLKAKAVIGLALSDEHLEHVRDCETAADTWKAVVDLFQRKTLLNKLTARRRFYSAKMADSEKALAFISRVRQLSADCKAMSVHIDDQDIAMTVLCGLPAKFEHLIVAIDAVADDTKLTMDFVKSRLLQEEQRMVDRGDVKPATDTALVNTEQGGGRDRRVVVCGHCHKRGHPDVKCWQKYPHLRPNHHKPAEAGMVVNTHEPPITDFDEHVCLMAGTVPDSVVHASRSTWVIDTGATSHICSDKSMFSDLQAIDPCDITIGDKSQVRATGVGTVSLVISVSGKPRNATLSKVLFSPDMGYNMLSVSVMGRAGIRSTFDVDCRITKGDKLLAEGHMHNGMYLLTTSTDHDCKGPEVALAADLNLWHRRMAHVHTDGIRDMVRNGVIEGVNLDLKKNLVRCEGCVYGKSTRAPIPQQGGARANDVLDLVHTDVCGPFPVPSIGGSRYFVSFVDDHCRYAWIFPIKAKSDVYTTFKRWVTMVERSHSKTLKVLQSDNGGEYVSAQMKQLLEQRGVQHRLTAPGNPHQNGVAERLNRTLVELVRSMLHSKGLSKKFWAEALSVAMHVRNRVTTRGLSSRTTPYEILFGRKPNVSYLRVFGSRCWYNIRKPDTDKLDPRAREALMIGYARGSRGYKLWDTADGKVVVSRDVRFDEDGVVDVKDMMPSPPNDEPVDIVLDSADMSQHPVPDSDDNPDKVVEQPTVAEDNPNDSDYVPDAMETDPSTTPGELEVTAQQVPVEPRRSTRQRKAPGAWWTAAVALISAAASVDPKSFVQAMSGPHGSEWMTSMTSEYDSLVENECWDLVPRPPHVNVVSSKWVYKTKEEQTAEGTLGVRRKSRLVARGFSQVEGVDYSETYAPVVKFTSVRVLLALVAAMDLLLHQMDVVTAFLNGDLREIVYMEQPQGFEQGDRAKVVCRLKKSLYGLKQAPRQWYAKIDDFFVNYLGMSRNAADDCVYVRRQGGQLLIIALYVDDLLIACSDEVTLAETKRELSSRFKMKDLGESRIILGMDICRDREHRTLSVCQSRYAQKVIERFGLASARGQPTPMDPAIELMGSDISTSEPYREAIGSLMYLMVGTRPDLAYCIGTLAKYVERPTELHWAAVKRVMRYVLHTKELGLVYGGTALEAPEVYVDADWAGDHETRKSMSGFVAVMSGAAVAWCARQQEVVAMSSAESEYISLCTGVKETVWLRRLLSGLEVLSDVDKPTVVHVDNQAAIALAHTNAVNRRNKHIDVRYHFTRQAVHDGIVQLQYCPTELMVADMLTKPLGRVKLVGFVEAAGMREAKAASSQ